MRAVGLYKTEREMRLTTALVTNNKLYSCFSYEATLTYSFVCPSVRQYEHT